MPEIRMREKTQNGKFFFEPYSRFSLTLLLVAVCLSVELIDIRVFGPCLVLGLNL